MLRFGNTKSFIRTQKKKQNQLNISSFVLFVWMLHISVVFTGFYHISIHPKLRRFLRQLQSVKNDLDCNQWPWIEKLFFLFACGFLCGLRRWTTELTDNIANNPIEVLNDMAHYCWMDLSKYRLWLQQIKWICLYSTWEYWQWFLEIWILLQFAATNEWSWKSNGFTPIELIKNILNL